MPYRINCPTCKASYSVPDDSLGKKLLCAKCRHPFTIGNSKAPAPPAAKPPLPAAPKAPAGRTTTDIEPAPVAKSPPRREMVTPRTAPADSAAPSKKPVRSIVVAIMAVLLFFAGIAVGSVVTAFYYWKHPSDTAVVQTATPKVEQEGTKILPVETGEQRVPTKLPAQAEYDNPPKPPTPDDGPTASTVTPSPSPASVAEEKPDPPVANRAELPRKAEVGQPFKYQLSRPMEKARSYKLHNGPKGLKISKEGLIQWTPEPGQVGTHRLLVGVVTDKKSGSDIYMVVVTAPGASTAKEALADLDRVPRDALAFCSLRVADTLKRPLAAGLRKQLQQEPTLNQFKVLWGLGVEDIDRVSAVFLSLKPEIEGVALVTTVKPYNRQRLLFLIAPEKQEMKAGTATYYVGKKNPVGVHFLNERTFLVGLGKDVKKFLERPTAKETPGPLSAALATAADAHTLVVGASPGLLMPIEKKDVPPPFQSYLPLLDAKSATLTLDADQDLRMGLRLAFADEEQAKKGEQAAKEALAFASIVMRQFPAMLEKIPAAEFKPLLPKVRGLIEATASAMGETPPRRNAALVEITMRVQSPDWFNTVVQAAPFLAPRPVKPTTPPAPPKVPPAAPKTAAEAEAVLDKLGFIIKHLDNKPDKPVVSLVTYSDNVSDDHLLLLRFFRDSLKELGLSSKNVSDKGMKNLAVLKKLESLSIGSACRFTGQGLADLNDLTELRSLTLLDAQLGDDALVHLKAFKKLNWLELGGNKGITDKGVVHLKKLTSLEMLRMRGSA